MMVNQRLDKGIQKQKILILITCFLLFLLAGIFQMIDSYLPEFWHVLFGLLAHVILISLVIAWGVSLLHRLVRKDLCIYFLIIALLMLFFLVLRMIKYGLTKEEDTLNRYLWYSYYVSLCFIPPTLLLASLSIENKKGKSLNKFWYLIYLPAVILVGFIYTNDLHEWVFALNFNSGDFSYSHRFIFYIALVWEILLTVTSIIIMIIKCQVSACKKKTWIPICTFVISSSLSAICFITDFSAFKIPELLCFTCIVSVESCIAIGLIPSNENYISYFYRLTDPIIITDKNMNVVYASKSSFSITKEQFQEAIAGYLMLDDYKRICGEKIHGGYVFKIEDLTHINEINLELEEINERLKEENDLIEVENEMKAQKAKINEQKELFTRVEEATKEELKRLNKLLLEIESNHSNYIDKMKFACVLGAYIKRRSNFIMLSRNNDLLDVQELALSIKESLNYLSFMGVEASLDFNLKGKISSDILGKIYDFFEIVAANESDVPSAFIIHITQKDEAITTLIESDIINKNIIAGVKKRFPTCTISEDEKETIYFSLTLSDGGIL